MALALNLEPGRTPWDLKFSLFRVPIRVHPLYWLASLLLCYRASDNFGLVLLAIACMFLSILVHEFGHIYAQKHYGDEGNHIVFWMFGGLAVPSSSAPHYAARVWISLWGPFAGFILGAIVYATGGIVFGWDFPFYYSASTFWFALYHLFWFNVAWGAMNLLPVFPLDGGQILQATGERKRKQQAWAFRISGYVACAVVLLCIAAYVFLPSLTFFRDPFMGILFFVLALQNFYFAWQIKRMGDFGGGSGEASFERREVWEQDPDWWKK